MPISITHLHTNYSLDHLESFFGRFTWTAEKGAAMCFSVRVKFSVHCYSKTADPPPHDPSWHILFDHGIERVFCPIRHGHSVNLPGLVNALFAQPRTKVSLTHDNYNWSFYCSQMEPALSPGCRYYVFFRIKRGARWEHDRGVECLDLFIESAYERKDRVQTKSAFPFGRVAERTALGLRL